MAFCDYCSEDKNNLLQTPIEFKGKDGTHFFIGDEEPENDAICFDCFQNSLSVIGMAWELNCEEV